MSTTSGAVVNGGLSHGAKIGIGVGVGLGGALVLGGVIFLCLRFRRRRSSRNPRSAGAGEYPMSETKPKGTTERSPVRYSKVPVTSGATEEPNSGSEGQRPVSSTLGDDWAPPEPNKETADGRVELEEQQGARHEMDARSLPDMEMDDEEEETRSLQDIEQAHGHT